mgnify:CR=1 FL=1
MPARIDSGALPLGVSQSQVPEEQGACGFICCGPPAAAAGAGSRLLPKPPQPPPWLLATAAMGVPAMGY